MESFSFPSSVPGLKTGSGAAAGLRDHDLFIGVADLSFLPSVLALMHLHFRQYLGELSMPPARPPPPPVHGS